MNAARRFIGLCAFVSISLFVACSALDERYLNIGEGLAPLTLKEFARQAKVEIVFNAPSVKGVVTNAVEGRMIPPDALDIMLSGTGLSFEVDGETGAYAVMAKDALRFAENNSK